MTKKEKKAFLTSIGVDLGENKRYTDYEIDRLHEIATNIEKYNNKSNSIRKSYTDWCSDGKYTRDSITTYTCKIDEDDFRVQEDYQYKDDDGQTGEYTRVFRKAREILGAMTHLKD